jgi:hypothetical protein
MPTLPTPEPATLEDALDILAEVIGQACDYKDDDGRTIVDSCALSSYAYAMRFLAQHGRLIIDSEAGRRIIAHWPPPTET